MDGLVSRELFYGRGFGACISQTPREQEGEKAVLCALRSEHGPRKGWLTEAEAGILSFRSHPCRIMPWNQNFHFSEKNGASVFPKFSLKTELQCNSPCSYVSWRAILPWLSLMYLLILLIYKTSLWVTSEWLSWNAQLMYLFHSLTS